MIDERPPEDDSEVTEADISRWRRAHERLHRNPVTSVATKVVVTVIGLAVLVAGIVMMVTPGPGLVGIVVGLAILASEWTWAERLLKAARRKLDSARRAAAEMDPAVKRRRALITGAIVVVVVGALAGAVALWGWPRLAIDGWDQAQSLLGFLPDLPGMPAAEAE